MTPTEKIEALTISELRKKLDSEISKDKKKKYFDDFLWELEIYLSDDKSIELSRNQLYDIIHIMIRGSKLYSKYTPIVDIRKDGVEEKINKFVEKLVEKDLIEKSDKDNLIKCLSATTKPEIDPLITFNGTIKLLTRLFKDVLGTSEWEALSEIIITKTASKKKHHPGDLSQALNKTKPDWTLDKNKSKWDQRKEFENLLKSPLPENKEKLYDNYKKAEETISQRDYEILFDILNYCR